jgi:tetratricopeptide (TPR) repeat protein
MAYKTFSKQELLVLTEDDLERILLAGKDGRPDYGFILYCYRLRKGWTGSTLAFLYSEALGNEFITASWVYIMEKQNKVPIDEKRRWILAQLLDIPPKLFGLVPLAGGALELQEEIVKVFRIETIDIVEYRAALEGHCTHSMSGIRQDAIGDVQRRIRNLEHAIHYTYSPEKEQMTRLLCEYLIFQAIEAHRNVRFSAAISIFSNVIVVADTYKLYDIWAHALRQRGVAYVDRGEIITGLVDFAAARRDFEMAAADFDAALKLKAHLSPLRYGLVLNAAGHGYIHSAQDGQQLKEALKLLDESAKAVGKDGDQSTISAKLDEERIHLTRGEALITPHAPALRDPVQARKELDKAAELSNPLYKARHISHHVRQAEAYFLEGQFPKTRLYYPDEQFTMAVAHAETVLDLLKETPSKLDLVRMTNLYRRLKESTYGGSQNVALLGAKILQLQHPEIFA